MCDPDVSSFKKAIRQHQKTPTIEELVVSLRLENEQLTLMMIMERILPFQYKIYWKKYDLKMCSKNFSQLKLIKTDTMM